MNVDRAVSALLFVAGCTQTVDVPPPLTVPPPTEQTPDPTTKPDTPDTTPLPARVQEIADALKPFLECPERMWQGYSLDKRQIVFVAESKKQAYLWNDQREAIRGTTTSLDYDALPERFRKVAYFDLDDYEGVSTLAIPLDVTARINTRLPGQEFAVVLAIHEGFHLWGQRDWPSLRGAPKEGESSDRDPDYPDNWRLRYLRERVRVSLRATPSSGSVGVVAHWAQTLRTELPAESEVLKWVDRLEGSAQYVSTVGEILGRLGCKASAGEVVSATETGAADRALATRFRAGSEPYEIGLFALTRLRASGAPGFEAKIVAGKTPLEVLIEGVSPVTQVDDPALVNESKLTIEKQNSAAKLWIDPLLENLADANRTRLVVPNAWVQGAFSQDDSFYLVNVPNRPLATRSFSGKMIDPTSTVSIKASSSDIVATRSSPCGVHAISSRVFTVPSGAVTLASNGKSVTIVHPSLQTTNLPINEVVSEGRKWLCVVAP